MIVARAIFVSLSLAGFVVASAATSRAGTPAQTTGTLSAAATHPGYVGSSQCIKCHEPFYQLWATSHHGLAMQPFTAEFARKHLAPQTEDIAVGNYRYRADVAEGKGVVRESGPDGEKQYPIHHAMGGKNVYYFLTPRERGRLQVLPVAFNAHTKRWYDAAASMVRHFLDRTDAPVHWTDPPLTFNAACYGCHVSQMRSNYNFATDSYSTVWAEPGINCETCHGPAEEHVRVCEAAPKGQPPRDLKLITVSRKNGYTAEQINDHCAPCHAKMYPVTPPPPHAGGYKPGDRFFDHYGLVALEDPDFYPDGRDLGENYTFTLWRMNPCAKSGQLDCVHCHTSSGRYRFGQVGNLSCKANDACMPCHRERVEKAAEHSHHKPDSAGNHCIACHMPMTEFALMRRSDHSMLPPTPAATIRFKSPNACNLQSCHDDKDAAWSDKYVREWHQEDYQAPVLHRAGLIDAARKRDWSRLPEMLDYLKCPDRDEAVATALIRLLQSCRDGRKRPALTGALQDPSPWVRSAAASALEHGQTPEGRAALVAATDDRYRLVRVSAAAALAGFAREGLSPEDSARWKRASDEYEAMLRARLDDWSSHYNLGNYYADLGEPQRALESLAVAMRLDPTRIPPLVNASMVHARQGDNAKAGELLRRALKMDPRNPEANFNLGLLLAESGDRAGAKTHLQTAWTADPTLAAAAYNLAVLSADASPAEAIELCRNAARARPDEPKYAYTLAFYLSRKNETREAESVLTDLIKIHPAYPDAYLMLADLYEKQGKPAEARTVYRQALKNLALSDAERSQLELRIRSLR